MPTMNEGYVKTVRGNVVEAVFENRLPEINNKVVAGEDKEMIFEVSLHVDSTTVKLIALTFTAGLARNDPYGTRETT